MSIIHFEGFAVILTNILLSETYLVNRIDRFHYPVFQQLEITKSDRIIDAVVFHKFIIWRSDELSSACDGVPIHVGNTTIAGNRVVSCRSVK